MLGWQLYCHPFRVRQYNCRTNESPSQKQDVTKH